MLDLSTQVLAITDAIDEIASFLTVGFVDQDDESMRRPAELPAAFVALDKVGTPDGKTRIVSAPITWVVIIRSKEIGGPSGCLSLVDSTIDKLHGLRVGSSIKTLSLDSVVFFDKREGSVSYAVRFKTAVTGSMSTSPCG